ncbi:MAG: hypothetical protein ACLFT3_01870 [Cyclobacteriaceae bacterium]
MKYVFYSLLLLVMASCREEPMEAQPVQEIVRLEQTSYATYLNREVKLIHLSLHEEGLPVRHVEVRAMQHQDNARGAFILTQGGFGNKFYGISFEKHTTLNHAFNQGLEVFEIRWMAEQGWASGVEGIGYPRAVRVYKEIVKWLKKHEMINPSLIISHGGSGGSFQIAYGLTHFGLEEEVDYAILAAGPPTADLELAIFGDPAHPAYWPSGIGGFAFTDIIHGWRGEGDYCVRRNRQPPGFVLDTLDKSSLLSKTEDRDYAYTTHLYFVNSNDETHADEQGRLFYEKVESTKEWHYLPDETSHDVTGFPAGAQKVREIIRTILRNKY